MRQNLFNSIGILWIRYMMTPVMIESLSDGIWSWYDFLLFQYAI
jgi:hypothetical protein